jgi:hypothetical protein
MFTGTVNLLVSFCFLDRESLLVIIDLNAILWIKPIKYGSYYLVI